MEGGGWIWLLVELGMVLLGIAIGYATAMWRHRPKDATVAGLRDERTREI